MANIQSILDFFKTHKAAIVIFVMCVAVGFAAMHGVDDAIRQQRTADFHAYNGWKKVNPQYDLTLEEWRELSYRGLLPASKAATNEDAAIEKQPNK